jgi:hypothetical protein
MHTRCGELKDRELGNITRELKPTSTARDGGYLVQENDRDKIYKKSVLSEERGRVNKKLEIMGKEKGGKVRGGVVLWDRGLGCEGPVDVDCRANRAVSTSVTSIGGGRNCLYCRIT